MCIRQPTGQQQAVGWILADAHRARFAWNRKPSVIGSCTGRIELESARQTSETSPPPDAVDAFDSDDSHRSIKVEHYSIVNACILVMHESMSMIHSRAI